MKDQPSRHADRWITVAGRKGGTGKTTLTLSLAAHYARKGAAVLLIDLDPQASLTAILTPHQTGEALADVLTAGGSPAPVPVADNITLLTGGPELEAIEPRPIREALGEAGADVILIDCPPGHPALDRAAMGAADVLLICAEAHRLAITGAARLLAEKHPQQSALVLGRLDARRGLDKAAPELLAGAFNLPVFPMHTSTALALAVNAGKMPPGYGRAADDAAIIARWIDKQTKRCK